MYAGSKGRVEIGQVNSSFVTVIPADKRPKIASMRRLFLIVSILALLFQTSVLTAQSNCPDASEDSNYRVVFENSRVRVMRLELGRLASTKSVCYKSSYVSIVTTESRTTRTVQGTMGSYHDWAQGEARFYYRPAQQVIRNETGTIHREVVIETFLPVEYRTADRNNYDTDEFGSDLSAVKPTWSTSFTRGALTATRIQLAPGDHIGISGADHVLIALSDLQLKDASGREIEMEAQDVTILKAGTVRKFTNENRSPAWFVVVDF